MYFKFVCYFCIFVVVFVTFSQGDENQPGEERVDDLINDAPYTKGVKGGVKGYKKGGDKKKIKIGCGSTPDPPINGNISCSSRGSSFSDCRATCIADYKFPNGKTELLLTCQEEDWKIQGNEWKSLPHCEPICLPQCQNNGMCIAPNQCNCPDNFSGPQCQYENKPCFNLPPTVLNAKKKCNSKRCTIECLKNHTFPDGSSITNLVCREGNWQPTRADWVSVPDCIPVCSPPCTNGGICLSLNTCQCPQDFRGPQCQYLESTCSPDKLGFNGGYQCSSDENSYSCVIHCPAGINFEFPPAVKYTCAYETGIFEPHPIPQCLTENGMKILSLSKMENTASHDTFNETWSIQRNFSSIQKEDYQNIHSSKSHHDFQDNLFGGQKKIHHMYDTTKNKVTFMENKRPEPRMCFTWGGVHYKTFDDEIFSFESECVYTLLQDSQNGLLTITVQNNPECKISGECYRIIKIFLQGKEYTVSRNDHGIPEFQSVKKILPIPIQLPNIRADWSAHFVVVNLDTMGLSIKWDGALLVQIEATESLWNKTLGLCGNMNGNIDDDLITKDGNRPKSIATFATSWKVQSMGEICDEYPNVDHSCVSNAKYDQKATEFCTKLLSDPKYQACSREIDLTTLYVTCRWDYCSCKNFDKRKCACDTMSVYVRHCAHRGIVTLPGWRNNNTCPLSCSSGKVYMSCGPKAHPSCGTELSLKTDGDSDCEEGCFCPSGSVLHEGHCISPEECPCRLKGKLFKPGTSVAKDCNTCTCSAGKWICTEARCKARCSIVGDPHYTTFDGKRFDFMGQCSYYLMKAANYSIEGENEACSGAISQSMGFSLPSSGMPSCTKTVTIRTNSKTIKLKQNRQVLIDGEDVTKFPLTVADAKIQIASSIFIVVRLSNKLEVWWDGVSRVYINAPPEFHGQTKGLCGTFSLNQKDDFLTPDGDVEQAVIPFGNKWKTSEECPDIVKKESNHPCDINPQKRNSAEAYCSHLLKNTFKDCHWSVDPEPFYKDCLYDMCACETNVDLCLCPTLSAYAKECAHEGVKILWRHEIEECRIHCSGGQEYQICGNSCARTCEDISFNQECRQECVEGCNCPEGQTLDVNGECIPIGECPCLHMGLEFPAGYREVRPGVKGQELCTCAGGVWNCQLATRDEIDQFPAIADIKLSCSPKSNMEVTSCKPSGPRTCRNMHEFLMENSTVCKPGCVCKSGYVLDAPSGVCVKEENCPCYHGGQSYKEGSTMQEECNTCKCETGTWTCTQRICSGVCSVWGDSHYKTFDGKLFDFQGVCDYVLVKGSLSREEGFDISVRNVPCGTSGVSCSKSINLNVGQESVTLTKGKKISMTNFKRIAFRQAGLFVFLDVPDLGLVLQWDQGTRVYVRLDPKWKSRTKGLCGDFNDNSEDDFKTPSGGVSEVSSNLFGDSWKKNSYCPEPKDIPDPCEKNPERRVWAVKKCGVLKSSLFKPCHSEVDVNSYIEKCIYDTCACDSGGDCECLCTALAAYAQECNARGVPIKWRSQSLCPIQCDETCSSYSPCISTCPRETCDNLFTLKDSSHLCGQDTCVEGCLTKSCGAGQVYANETYLECVPKEICNPVCLEINGTIYKEGDKVKGDECHTCFCSRGSLICKGEPCTTVAPKPTIPNEESRKCVDGWTPWLNRDVPLKGRKVFDIEPLPSSIELLNIKGSVVCSQEEMVDIRCRTVGSKKSPKETGLDVECSLERGLYCRSKPAEAPCADFEISVLCRCSSETSSQPRTTTVTSTLTSCDVNRPNQMHPTDCHLFYHCVPQLDGAILVEKSCGSTMFYNPETQICDWPSSVLLKRPECAFSVTTEKIFDKETVATVGYEICKPSEFWNQCAVQCSKTCESYRHSLENEGICNETNDCIPGCTPIEKPSCPANKFWRDKSTCVSISDCPCISHKKELVKPGMLVEESECEKCQCINNYYTCDKSSCNQNVIETPLHCDEAHFISLVNGKNPLPDEAFSSSSILSEKYKPSDAKLNNKVSDHSAGSWSPKEMNRQQWISVEFPEPTPVYGIITQGSPLYKEFVESFHVFYSTNGDIANFKPLTMPGLNTPKLFKGSHSSIATNKFVFQEPIVAKIVKIQPHTWSNAISIRFELLGCANTTQVTYSPTTDKETTLIVTSTVSPPKYCEQENYVWLTKMVPKDFLSYAASSSKGLSFKPENSVLTEKSTKDMNWRSWQPQYLDKKQWLEIKLAKPEPLYGIILQGSPSDDKYVTSYYLMHSENGLVFSYIIDKNGDPTVFQGPIDKVKPVQQIFNHPIEAAFVRIIPQTWHKGIAIRAQLIGCNDDFVITKESFETTTPFSEISTTTDIIFITKEILPVCNDTMGLDEGLMSDQQISSSSSHGKLLPNLKLSNSGIWRANLDNPEQFVEFDFLEGRNLTGVDTRGADNIWTTAYKIFYSLDGKQWNPVVDSFSNEKLFLANIDDVSVKTNYFARPLHARFLRIRPIKWHNHVGLKAEIRGCFLPYAKVTTSKPLEKLVSKPPEVICNVCTGIGVSIAEKCNCTNSLWWDGETCVGKEQCPCVVGHMPYAVGSAYETEDCQQCLCTMGGTATCHEKICEPCKEPGFRSIVTELCGCVCKPCPSGSRLCPTSNVCINETSWCNGIQDCPDDEQNCPVSTTLRPTETTLAVKTTIAPQNECEKPTCPPGYKVVQKKIRKPSKYTSRYAEYRYGHRGGNSGTKGGNYGVKGGNPGVKGGNNGFKGGNNGVKGGNRGIEIGTGGNYQKENNNELEQDLECPQFSCISNRPPPDFEGQKPKPCPKIECPPNYQIIFEKMSMYKFENCPRYTCRPPPPTEVVCKITERTFNTFDNMEYKYDICNHILARDRYANRWYISVEKKCSRNRRPCAKDLIIVMDNDLFIFYPDMHVEINDFTYTPSEMKRFNDKNSEIYKISRVGDVLYFISYRYGFWVIFDSNSNVKIGVSVKLFGQIDGLCGFFDGNPHNDRQKPDGTEARTALDFGNSWIIDGTPECELQVCSQEVQEKAWKMCNAVKDRSLAVCSSVVNLDKFISRCLETACSCLQSNSTLDDCRCRIMTSFVTECQANDQDVDLSNWRNIHNCQIECKAPLVHHDCFRNKCELCCNSLQEVEPCPKMKGVCFSGCFCPPGLVRNGEECVHPTECRDCVCDGFGNTKYVTFDRKNFVFDGNCTFVLSRDAISSSKKGSGAHTYQVLVTKQPCETGVCTEAITVLYQSHVIQIKKDSNSKQFVISIDETLIRDLPHNELGLNFKKSPGNDVTLLIPAIQLEVVCFEHDFAFTLRLPSQTFGDAMEGLCGNCNANQDDDFKQQNGKITEDVTEFGLSWKATNLPSSLKRNEEHCISKQKKCSPQSLDHNPCKKLLDSLEFGQCHRLVDPEPFLLSCQETLCNNGNICNDLEVYARTCQHAGVCPKWRNSDLCPYTCPSHLEYRSCGTGCVETCKSITSLEPKKCSDDLAEGCYCPEDLVMHNGTCISRRKCLGCDDEGHVEGDVWYPEKCTKCTCDKKTVKCLKTECETTVCEENYMRTLVPGSQHDCCSKYICVPNEGSNLCEEPQKPQCGFGQILKASVTPAGCQKFICECLPKDQCPDLSEIIIFDEELEPGFVRFLDQSGCCPQPSKICKPETCPQLNDCPRYFKSVKHNGPCCSFNKCVPPTNLCLVPDLNKNSSVESIVPKKIGEKWRDGKCTTCSCDIVDYKPMPQCMTKLCPRIQDHPDFNDFVLEDVAHPYECCSSFKKIACKDNNQVYKDAEEWTPNPQDVCMLKKCNNGINGLQKEIVNQECNTACDKGYEYRPSLNKSISCCGECVGVACVVNDDLKNIGDNWQSTDYCVNYTCQLENGSPQLKAFTETCREIDPSDEQNFVFEKRPLPGKCCPDVVKTACKYEGKIYKSGEKWKLSNDKCKIEVCTESLEIRQEIITCNKECSKGWEYVESRNEECCGKCEQRFCLVESKLYQAGEKWKSDDNCTTFECVNQQNQFLVTSTPPVCPELINCPSEFVYNDGCCSRCNSSSLNIDKICMADVMDLNATIGIIVEKRGSTFCKNLQPLKGLTECRGSCSSSTRFDLVTWGQQIDCRCCLPTNYQALIVELTCEDGKNLRKQIIVPTSCSCDTCGSTKAQSKNRKIGTKG